MRRPYDPGSRFSFAIDVREWGFADPRGEMVRQARNQPVIRQIGESETSGTSGATTGSPRS